MRSVFFVFCLLLAPSVWAQAPTGEYAAIDELWMKRDDPASLKQLTDLTDATLKAHPSDYEALWRAARLAQWQADGEADKEKKMALGKEAWRLGDLARDANPKAVQGYYYAALGIGAYSQGRGVVHALTEGLESKFNERLDKAIVTDPNYHNGGGIVAKGRYFYELPWPKRSLTKSKENLNAAIMAHPENLRAYVYLAQTQLKDGDAKAAQETLQKALNGGVTYDPPEGRRAKAMAAPVEAEIQKELK